MRNTPDGTGTAAQGGGQLRGSWDFQAGPEEETLGMFLLNYSEHGTCPRCFLASVGGQARPGLE